MTFALRPAIRENTPLIVGLGGPTKSGKTYSAHRLARGIAGSGLVAMLNAEGPRGHQYADKFGYHACDIDAPFGYERYQEAILEIAKAKPACLIIDSASHAHDGPGGMLEQHDTELDRMAGDDWKKRERMTFAAWVRPKKAENAFIYAMLGMRCPIVLCFRAKEKIRIVPGQQPVDLGWQPIASDRIAFETIFTLMLPPHSKGVPDLTISDMREPFETFVTKGQPIDEALGQRLAEWAKGSAAPRGSIPPPSPSPAGAAEFVSEDEVDELRAAFAACDPAAEAAFLKIAKTKAGIQTLDRLTKDDVPGVREWIERRKQKAGAAA